jgi:hypothetical protein
MPHILLSLAPVVAILATLSTGTASVVAEEAADRQRRIVSRLEQLRKPIEAIRISREVTDDAPPNLAAKLMETDEPVWVTADGEQAFLPDRYSVCFRHRPLYFQELNLERCGTTYGIAQNAVSASHFLTNTALLPYRMATRHPDETVNHWGDCRSDGHYRGDIEPLGCSGRAVLAESAAVAGFVFLLL